MGNRGVSKTNSIHEQFKEKEKEEQEKKQEEIEKNDPEFIKMMNMNKNNLKIEATSALFA